jgi:APA family basic amino acid/polyamine antiporter
VTGLITVAAALSYGELAGMMPKRRSICLHSACVRKISVFLWLDCFTVIQTGVIAAIAVTFANYSAIFPGIRYYTFRLGDSFVFLLVNCWLVLLYSFINTKGIESGKLIQLILTSAKLIALLH